MFFKKKLKLNNESKLIAIIFLNKEKNRLKREIRIGEIFEEDEIQQTIKDIKHLENVIGYLKSI